MQQSDAILKLLGLSMIWAGIILIGLLAVAITPRMQFVYIEDSHNITDRIQVGLWSACLARHNRSSGSVFTSPEEGSHDFTTLFCTSLGDFNSKYAEWKQKEIHLYDPASHTTDNKTETRVLSLRVNNASTGCDASTAPYVIGAIYTNDTLFGATHVRYNCVSGYESESRYNSDTFCTCNATACKWSTPPICKPTDNCLPDGSFTKTDICRIGDNKFVNLKAMSIANPGLGLDLSNDTIPVGGYIFPQMVFECSGEIRQWDLVVATPGIVYIDVWRPSTEQIHNKKTITLVGSNIIQATSVGLQGFIVDSSQQIGANRGDFIGIHYANKDNNQTKAALIMIEKLANSTMASCSNVEDCKVLQVTNVTSLFLDTINVNVSVFEPVDDASGSYSQIALVGYVTIGGMVPTKDEIVQGLFITCFVTAMATFILLLVLAVEFRRRTKHLVDGETFTDTEEANVVFDKLAPMFWAAICCTLVTGVGLIDEYALFFSSYNCNQDSHWKVGICGPIVLAAGIAAVALIVLVCIVEKRCTDYLTVPVVYAGSSDDGSSAISRDGHDESPIPPAEGLQRRASIFSNNKHSINNAIYKAAAEGYFSEEATAYMRRKSRMTSFNAKLRAKFE